MLDLRHRVSLSQISHVADDKLYVLVEDLSSVDIFDCVTGSLLSTVSTEGYVSEDVMGICVSGSKMLLYNRRGAFTCFDTVSSSPIGEISIKLKSSSAISGVCGSRRKDDLFFVTTVGNKTLSVIHASVMSLTLVNGIRLPDSMNKTKQDISKLISHPMKPYIFVCFKKGAIQVWNYTALKRLLIARLGTEEMEPAGGDFGGTGENDDVEDESEVIDDNKKSSSKIETSLLPVALLFPPENEVLCIMQNCVVSSNGKTCAVVWRNAICVYNTTMQQVPSDWKLLPSGSFKFSPGGDVIPLNPMVFHVSEPILFQIFSERGETIVASLTLLVPSLTIVSRCVLEGFDQEKDEIVNGLCTKGGQLLVMVKRKMPPEEVNIAFHSRLEWYSLSSSFERCGSWMSPVINRLSVPPDTYINGDSSLLHKDTSNSPGGNMPLVLVVHSNFDVFEEGAMSGRSSNLKPVFTTFSVFRIKLNASSSDPKGAILLGQLPKFTRKSASTILDIPSHDFVSDEGLFSPQKLKYDENMSHGVSGDNEWFAMLIGNSWRVDPSHAELSAHSVVCFMHFKSELSFSFGKYKDAMFFYGESANSTNNANRPTSVVVLSESGRQLKHISFEGASGSHGKDNCTIDIPILLSQIYSSSTAEKSSAVLVSAIDHSGKTHCGNFRCDLQHIFLASLKMGISSIDLENSKCLTLEKDETVMDVCWQPVSSVNFNDCDDLQVKRHDCWVDREAGLKIGVLTSSRVLLLSSTLDTLNSIRFRHACNNHVRLQDKAVSICWVGGSLAYTLESGAVNYLIQEKSILSPLRNSFRNSFVPFAGKKSSWSEGRICTLPTSHANGGYVRLCCCLPDRLVYLTREEVGEMFVPSIIFRPCLPLEPLALGLLQDESCESSKNTSSDQMDVKRCHKASLLQSLLTLYVPAKPAIGMSSENGALPMTHASRKLCNALRESGFEKLSLIAAGLCTNDREPTGSDFLYNRWISPGVKFQMAMQAGLFSTACNDILATRQGLQELFLDPESFGGSTMPHPRSAIAKQYSCAARLLAFSGQYDLARKMADIAGDDMLLSTLLKHSAPDKLKLFESSCQGKNAALAGIAKAACSEGSKKIGLEWNLFVGDVGGANRRTSMLNFSSPLTNEKFTATNTKIFQNEYEDLAAADRAQKLHASQRGAGLGPSTKLGLLAMDSVEDWLGKSLPEVVQASATETARMDSEGNEEDEDEAAQYPNGIERPLSWVDDVGTGREWDKIAGYWRFSDVVRPGEPGFVSSGMPKSRLNVLDLSNFKTPLEIFSDTKTRLRFEKTLSAVDPGEDHLKVKDLNDIIYCPDGEKGAPGKPVVGMRLPVGRGSALDVGMYHVDPNRQRLTVELNILRMEDASDQAKEKHILIQRFCAPDSPTLLWGLYVSSEGKLIFQVGEKETNCIESSAGEINMGPTDDMPVSLWSHVALVVESSASQANVTLCINGENTKKGHLDLPSVPEDKLSKGFIYVGPDLCGWRLTELRLWADCRAIMDIDSMKENYLPLASKRKRLQFRIKGSKQLFGPPPGSLSLGDPSDSSAEESDQLEKISLVTRDVSSRKVFGLAAPASKKVTLSGPGTGKPTSRRGAVVRGDVDSDDKATGNAGSEDVSRGLPKPSSSLRRMSALAAPPKREDQEGPGDKDVAEKNSSSGAAVLSPAQKRLQARKSTATLPHPRPQDTKEEVADEPPEKKVERKQSHDSVWSCPLEDISGFSSLELCRCIRRRPLTPSAVLAVPQTSRSDANPSLQEAGKISLLQLAMTRAGLLGNSKPFLLSTLEYSAESVVAERLPGDGESGLVLAIFNQKKLTVINTKTQSKTTELPMTAPLVFWCFTSSQELFLVTASALFLWKYNATEAPIPRPQKLAERIDVADQARWMERKVLDARVHSSGWIMVTSCPRLDSSGRPASFSHCMEGCYVTLYHPPTKRNIQFCATCGMFIPASNDKVDSNDPTIAVYVFHHENSKHDGTVFVLNLSNVTDSMLSTLPRTVRLDTLDQEQFPIIAWSLLLEPGDVHTSEMNQSPLTVPGFSLGAYQRREQPRFYVLTNCGDLYLVCIEEKKVVKTLSVSDQTIVASTIVMSEDPLLYYLTGTSSILSSISLLNLESK